MPTQVLIGHTADVNSVSFSAYNTCLVTGSRDTTVRLWDFKTGSMLGIFSGHKAPVTSVSWSFDNNIASASLDSTVCLWKPLAFND